MRAPRHAHNSAQTHPQQCPDTPAKVPRHARNIARTRPHRCPQTPATMPVTTMPAHAHNSAQVARNGSPQQIEEDGSVTSDEEVLEQMLLLTRSYYLNIQAYSNQPLDTASALALLERLSCSCRFMTLSYRADVCRLQAHRKYVTKLCIQTDDQTVRPTQTDGLLVCRSAVWQTD
jgi:hypothetical protein